MDNILLKIENIHVSVNHTPILKGLQLELPQGQVHVIMGPNGAGKSTLAKILAGHPAYEVTEGQMQFKGKDLIPLAPEERACLGLFMGFQYPVEIAGVSNAQFLQHALNAQRKARQMVALSDAEFSQLLEAKMSRLQIRPELKERGINEGFSGGEKKRNEILQMALFEPDLMILDETDSGLDIDAMRQIAEGVNALRAPHRSILIITHYQRLLDYIKPDRVHVLAGGVIVRSGGPELALALEEKGYEWITG